MDDPSPLSRLSTLSAHLGVSASACSSASESSATPPPPPTPAPAPGHAPTARLPPIALALPQRSSAARRVLPPAAALIAAARDHPALFRVELPATFRPRHFVVAADPSLIEDVLTFEDLFQSLSLVGEKVFMLSSPHPVHAAFGQLSRALLLDLDRIASETARALGPALDAALGGRDEGVVDLRDLGEAVFWPLTEALLGAGASRESAPGLRRAFDAIQAEYADASRGRRCPALRAGVAHATDTLRSMLAEARAGGRPVGSVPDLQLFAAAQDADVAARFSTAMWWAALDAMRPLVAWCLGLLLANPRAGEAACAEARRTDLDPGDLESLPYARAALQETLRVASEPVAWRLVTRECTVFAPGDADGFALHRGDLVGAFFAMRLKDPRVHERPLEFAPERFVGSSPFMGGGHFAFAPFSAGTHTCPARRLVIGVAPVVVAATLRRYELALLDPLPAIDESATLDPEGACLARMERGTRVAFARRGGGGP